MNIQEYMTSETFKKLIIINSDYARMVWRENAKKIGCHSIVDSVKRDIIDNTRFSFYADDYRHIY